MSTTIGQTFIPRYRPFETSQKLCWYRSFRWIVFKALQHLTLLNLPNLNIIKGRWENMFPRLILSFANCISSVYAA